MKPMHLVLNVQNRPHSHRVARVVQWLGPDAAPHLPCVHTDTEGRAFVQAGPDRPKRYIYLGDWLAPFSPMAAEDYAQFKHIGEYCQHYGATDVFETMWTREWSKDYATMEQLAMQICDDWRHNVVNIDTTEALAKHMDIMYPTEEKPNEAQPED